METSSGKLAAVAKLENLARSTIPGLVPQYFAIAKVVTDDGRDVEFSLTEYIQGSVALESIWPKLDHAEEEGLVDEIVAASVQVHRIDRKVLEEQVDVG